MVLSWFLLSTQYICRLIEVVAVPLRLFCSPHIELVHARNATRDSLTHDNALILKQFRNVMP